MSFGHHTPESLLARTDSKDPATTCKGLTTSGRLCRRALGASANASPAGSPAGKGSGVVAVLDEGNAAAFFCWQHKDQAEALIAKLSKRTQVIPLKQKSSIDTLIERVGILELDDEVGSRYGQDANGHVAQPRNQRRTQHSSDYRRRDTLPQEWRRIQGPLMSVPEDVAESEGYRREERFHRRDTASQHRQDRRYTQDRTGRSNTKASWSCCIQIDNDDYTPPPRPRTHRSGEYRSESKPRPHARLQSEPMRSSRTQYYPASTPSHLPTKHVEDYMTNRQHASNIVYPQNGHPSDFQSQTPPRRPIPSQAPASPPNSQTAALLSLIPQHLGPTTASALMSELSKPISPADEEGYIYIFWLTPESDLAKPDDETASSLLDGDDDNFTSHSPSRFSQGRHYRRQSEVDRRSAKHSLTAQALRRFASINRGPSEPKKILLKIGRANNVHRRLSQWTKQCGQNITLIRYYPYQSQDMFQRGVPSSNTMRRTVRHVHRVERLIHLELADQRVAGKGKCDQCGREHKEWFEVDATREGVRAVDDVVRRWIDWANSTDM